MVSEKLGAAFMEVGADLGPLEKSLGSIPGMMQHAGTNITGGLKSSLQGGNFSDVGKQLGNQLVTGMTSQFGMLGQAAGTFATALGPAGIALLGIGASIGVIGVGLGKCVSSAATWQDLMVDVQKVTNTTEAGFSKLSSDLLAIRGETGASMESIAGAAAGAGRMGIAPEEIADYTETILKMSSAWGMSADAASESIGKIGSVVKPAEMSWTEFGNRMGSTINDLADSMATSEESIVTGMKKVSAQMAMLKPSPEQLSDWAALIGQLQAFGMTAETSGESLKDALNYMMRDDKGGISSMLDMDATEFQEAIREDAIGTIQELAVAISELPIEEQGQALQKFGATGGQMMGMLVGKVDPVTKEVEGLNAALATGASAWENASSLNEAYAKSQETLNAQIEIFKGKISVAATSIGTVLLPYLTQMMEAVNDITQALIDLGTRGWQWLTGGAEGENVTERAAAKTRSWADSQGWLSGYLANYDAAKARDAGEDIGKDLAGEIEPAVTEAVEGGLTDPNIKETAKKTGEEAGSAAGSGYMNAWNDEMKRWADYHETTVQRFSRTGTVSAGSDTIEFIKTADSYLNWAVHINGKSLTGSAYESEQAAMDAIRTQFPGLWALMDPSELKAAILEAHGNFGEAAEIRAQLELGTPWERFVEELAPTQAQIAEIQAAYEKTYAEAFKTGAFIGDMESAMKDLGDTGAKAFSDGWISGTEAEDMVDKLIKLQFSDPEKFAAAGGEEALNFWRGMQEKLTDLSVAIATGADPDSIREMIAGIQADLAASDFNIEVQADVKTNLFGGLTGEALMPTKSLAELLADPAQLNKEIGNFNQWRLNTFQPALQSHIDDAYSIWKTGYATEEELNREYFATLQTNAESYGNWYRRWQYDLIQQYQAGEISIDDFFRKWDLANQGLKETTEKSNAKLEDQVSNLAKLTAECSECEEAMSSFGIAQEKAADMFLGSFIGSSEDRIKWLAESGELEKRLALGGIGLLPGEVEAVQEYRMKASLDTEFAEEARDKFAAETEKIEAKMKLGAIADAAYGAVDSFVGWADSITAWIYVGAYGPGTEYTGGGSSYDYLESLSPGITSSEGWGTSSWLPQLAEGGIVTAPTIARIAENNRPEAIIPLDALAKIIGKEGGGDTFNFVFNGEYNEERIKALVVDGIREAKREDTRRGSYA